MERASGERSSEGLRVGLAALSAGPSAYASYRNERADGHREQDGAND